MSLRLWIAHGLIILVLLVVCIVKWILNYREQKFIEGRLNPFPKDKEETAKGEQLWLDQKGKKPWQR